MAGAPKCKGEYSWQTTVARDVDEYELGLISAIGVVYGQV